MNPSVTPVSSLADLVAVLAGKEPRTLEIQTSIASPFPITLPPGFNLTGKNKESCILGFCNGDSRPLAVTDGEVTDRTGFSS